MRSINIYDLINPDEKNKLKAFEHNNTKFINNFEENMQTVLMENNTTPNGYRSFRIVADKVYDQTVRVKGEVVRQIIVQETYQAYFKESNRRKDGKCSLVTLCKMEDSDKMKSILLDECGMKFDRHKFDILKIIKQASDVRKANFNVQIETVTSVSMNGTNVDTTEYYAELLQQGNLKAVIIIFNTPNQSVTFRISTDGHVLLYSQLDDSAILDLVEQLAAI